MSALSLDSLESVNRSTYVQDIQKLQDFRRDKNRLEQKKSHFKKEKNQWERQKQNILENFNLERLEIERY